MKTTVLALLCAAPLTTASCKKAPETSGTTEPAPPAESFDDEPESEAEPDDDPPASAAVGIDQRPVGT